MGAQHSSAYTDGWSDETIELFFLKSGRPRHLRGGNRFITEGETVNSVFLITEGEVAVKKRERGTTAKQIGTRAKGSLLGELSFLLGQPATVTLEAMSSSVSIVDLPQIELIEMLKSSPQLAGGFFRLLGGMLAERISEISSGMRNSLIHSAAPQLRTSGSSNSGSNAALAILPSNLDTSVSEVAAGFGLPEETELFLHCDCAVSIEENSVVDGQRHNGKLYLFESHACFSFSLFGFNNQRVIALSDVLAVRLPDEGRPADAGPSGARRVIEVNCNSLSLALVVSAAICDTVSRSLESARVNSMDMSGFSKFPTGAAEVSASAESLEEVALAVDTNVLQMMQGLGIEDGGAEGVPAACRASASNQRAQQSTAVDAGHSELARLTKKQWHLFLKGADSLRLARGTVVIREGDTQRAFYQMVEGSCRVELQVKGRPQAVVVGHRNAGDLFGERSLLLGGTAAASVVVDSEEAVLLRLRVDFLQELFSEHADLMGKFFCLLAVDQAKRLSRLTQDISLDHKELILSEGLHAPTDMHSLLSNHAYLTIVTRYIRSLDSKDASPSAINATPRTEDPAAAATASSSASDVPVPDAATPAPDEAAPSAKSKPNRTSRIGIGKGRGEKKATPRSTPRSAIIKQPQAKKVRTPRGVPEFKADGLLSNQLAFITELRSIKSEHDPAQVLVLVQQTHAKFIATGSLGCLNADTIAVLEKEVSGEAPSMAPSKLRKLFDRAEQAVVAAIEAACLQDFLSSSMYNYVLSLLLKTQVLPTIDHFKAVKVLGEGGFGQVLEVIKRDCGKVYAMKVMKKAELIAAFEGEDWREIVLLEKQLHASMRHPLVVNLAYSFQNSAYIVLVMDACPGGDLSVFALTEDRLTPLQVRFVGQEVTCVLGYLHSLHILYRDLKPENLLLDAHGHVRLIDFGLAAAGTNAMPFSDEMCGTPCYMAPEVKNAGRKGVKKYSGAADWFTLGVLLYEMSEQRLPFGDEPRFIDHKTEWRKPHFMNEDGKKDDQLLDLVKGLLEWKVEKRLGGGKLLNTAAAVAEVKAHKYWRDPEWQLVDQARLPSPLLPYVESRSHTKEAESKLKKKQRAAVEMAVRMANSEKQDEQKERLAADTSGPEDVVGWDFVSKHAIEQEYVEIMASSVSLL